MTPGGHFMHLIHPLFSFYLVKIKYPFCDINPDGCPSLSYPQCNEGVQTGEEFCFCSLLDKVPSAPDVRKNIFLHNNRYDLKLLLQAISRFKNLFKHLLNIEIFLIRRILLIWQYIFIRKCTNYFFNHYFTK